MKKTLQNFMRKLLTSAMLFAFLFNANFAVIESAYAQYGDWTDTTVDTGVYGNPSWTNNPNVDYVTYGCEYYGSCNNNNNYSPAPTYNNNWTDTTVDTNVYGNPSWTNNPNVDYVTPSCEYYGSCGSNNYYPVYTQPAPVYTNPEPVYNNPVYTNPSPVYNEPVYNNPVYTNPAPIYNNPAPIYTNPAPVYTNPAPIYTQPNPIYVTPSPVTDFRICPDGSRVATFNSCPVPPAPVYTYYCAINGQTYNSQEAYNANCVNRVSLYCALNGQTYNSQSSYAEGCRKYCSINGFYYATQNDFDNFCKAPVQPTFYCSINGQTYNTQAAYNQFCVNPIISLYCSINGVTYNSQAAYDAGCRAPVINLYCAINGQTYNSQEAYNANCVNRVSLYCALNGQTYNSQSSYAEGCRKYCSINGFYYATQNDFDNFCKAPVTPVWYCTVNGRTYYSQNDYNNNCKNVIRNDHRVITTVPTQITKTSARCNGVAMIVNNINTTGYFEYGTSANLGLVTNSGNIGNRSNTEYSNLITNLKPNTTYYCRAVITNINGTYKGELMSFRTATEHVQYIPIVTAPKPIKHVIKGKTVIKSDKGGIDITCKDIEGNSGIIKAGQKLATVNFEKVSGEVKKGGLVDYKLVYKNTSSELTLSNVIVKVTAPKDMTFVDKSVGEYDAIENTLIIEDARVKSGETVEKIIKMQIADNVTAGKSLIVNSYLSYEVLDTKGSILKDEITNYSVVTVIDSASNISTNNPNTDTKVKNEVNSILPNTVLEWIAIIVLFMILFILGRVIFRDIRGIKTTEIHH